MLNLSVLLSGFLLASFMMTLYIVVYSFRKKTSISSTFALTCLCIAIYSFGYAMEINSQSLHTMLFWNGLQYLGLPFIGAFWVIMALKYTNKHQILDSPVFKSGVFLIPFITFILRLTNEFHHFYYTSVSYDAGELFPVLHLEKGPWYLVNFLYYGVCFITSNYLFFSQYRRSSGVIRKQCILMFIASVLPWISMILDLLNLSPYGIDFGPFTTTIACVLFLLALFRFRLFDLTPLAKDKIFEFTQDGLVILDADFNILEYNPAASQIIPCLRPKSIGVDIRNVLGAGHIISQAITEAKTKQYDIVLDDKKSYYSVNASDIRGESNELLGKIITITDVTKYVEIMDKLNQLATKDDLTGVYNRRHFFERSIYELERVKRNHGSLSLIIIDLDNFKQINDTFGHPAGDRALVEVSGQIQRHIRAVDLLARFGGEEFVILLPDTSLEDAVNTAERIRINIEALEIFYDDHKIHVSSSFGVTGINSVNQEDLSIFLKKADQALYKAKEDGRNCVRIVQ